MRKQLSGAALALIIAAAGLAGTSLADGHGGVAEVRLATMKAIGGHMGALAAVAKGEAAADAGTAVHAKALQELGIAAKALFPKGSGGEKTRAKPEIWSEPMKFTIAMDAFNAATPKLTQAAMSGDPAVIGAALKEVGRTCGGCHKPFRKPKD